MSSMLGSIKSLVAKVSPGAGTSEVPAPASSANKGEVLSVNLSMLTVNKAFGVDLLSIPLPDGEAAFMTFRRDTATKTITVVDLRVPLRLRGNGLGTKLVRELHAYCEAGGYTCAPAEEVARPFLAAVLAKKGNESMKDCFCASKNASAGVAAAGPTSTFAPIAAAGTTC